MSEPITNRPADYKPHKITLIRRLSLLKDTMIDWVYYTPIQWCRNVKRLLYWLPVIWNDRDYDHNSLYKIVDHKLQSIEKDSENWHWVGCQDQTKKIKQIRQWIENANADEFDLIEDEYQDFIDKYGELVSWTKPIEGSSMFEFHLAHEKCTDQKMADDANQQYLKLCELAHQRHNMYRNRVWKSIGKHIDRWWD